MEVSNSNKLLSIKILDIDILKKISIILPFVIVFIGEILNFTHPSLGSISKFLAIIYMTVFILLNNTFSKNLVIAASLFLFFLLYSIMVSFNFFAALEATIRYLFLVIVLFYSYSIKNYARLIFTAVIIYALLNNLYQIYVYIQSFRGVPMWFYSHVEVGGKDIYWSNSTMGISRAVGLTGFFALYGFLNLIAFFLVKNLYKGKFKNGLLLIFFLGLFASLSFKAIGVFVFILFITSKYKLNFIIGFAVILVLSLAVFPTKVIDFTEQLFFRIETYITEGNSARSDSYRVMFEDIAEGNLFGRGAGSFGGAASTKYNSPVYAETNFNWYGLERLATTDTYYPHLFVELGILGAASYLIFIFTPLIRPISKKKWLTLIAIYLALLFDSLFSFALNNVAYLMLSIVLVYPIIVYEINKPKYSD